MENTATREMDPIREDSQTEKVLDLLLALGAMKNLPRTGWRLAGIKECESVADHSFRVAVIALALGEWIEGVDRDRLLRMAVLHDVPESLVTDLPLSAVKLFGREAKFQAEKEAWSLLLPPGQPWEGWHALWQEYQAGETTEARLAHVADKLDMLMQAHEYEQAGHRNLDEFFQADEWDDGGFEQVQALFRALMQRRRQFGEHSGR